MFACYLNGLVEEEIFCWFNERFNIQIFYLRWEKIVYFNSLVKEIRLFI